MAQYDLHDHPLPLIIDHCEKCNSFWFDSGEYRNFLLKEYELLSDKRFDVRIATGWLIFLTLCLVIFLNVLVVKTSHPMLAIPLSRGLMSGVFVFSILRLFREGLNVVVKKQYLFIQFLILALYQPLYAFVLWDTGESLLLAFALTLMGSAGGAVFFYFWQKNAPPIDSEENLLVTAFEKVLNATQAEKEYVAKTIARSLKK